MPKVSSENREQYLQTRRDQIIDASIKVFAAKGYAGANVADIAKEAGIGKGTLYLYFKNKEDIFNSILTDRSFVPKMEPLLHNSGMPVEEVLTLVAKEYLEYIPKFLPLFRLAIAEYYRFPERSHQLFGEIIQSGIHLLAEYLKSQEAAGQLHNIENAENVARVFLGMMAAYVISQQFLEPASISAVSTEVWAKETVHMLLKGIEG